VVDKQVDEFWNESVYTMWLNTLKKLSLPTTGNEYPECMRTKAWAMKTLNTQMGSWAALRHDTILYTKPARALVCGCDYPLGYVEPRLEFWQSLHHMAKKTATMVGSMKFPDKSYVPEDSYDNKTTTLSNLQNDISKFLNRFAEIVDVLVEITKKQLAQIALTKEEGSWLRKAVEETLGGSGMGSLTGWYYELFYPSRFMACKADVIVADVQTAYPDLKDPKGSVLHIGLGEVDVIAMVAENVGACEGQIFKDTSKEKGGFGRKLDIPPVPNPSHKVTKEEKADKTGVFYGPLFSFFEFEVQGINRLTDADWGTLLDSPTSPARPDWSDSYLVHTPVKAMATRH